MTRSLTGSGETRMAAPMNEAAAARSRLALRRLLIGAVTVGTDGLMIAGSFPRMRQRNLFLVHVFLRDRSSPQRIEQLLDAYAVVEFLAGCFPAKSPESTFHRATAMFSGRRAQARLDWIDEVRPILLPARSKESTC